MHDSARHSPRLVSSFKVSKQKNLHENPTMRSRDNGQLVFNVTEHNRATGSHFEKVRIFDGPISRFVPNISINISAKFGAFIAKLNDSSNT